MSEDELERWRRRLREALGSSGGLLADVLPELALLLGPQPPAPELPAAEARHRFHATLRRFVAACVQKEHPMVLFLDDLQWADAGSLQLLEQLVTHAIPQKNCPMNEIVITASAQPSLIALVKIAGE